MKVLMIPIEVLALFALDGSVQPLRFRIENKEGELMTIYIEQLISQTEDRYAGNPMMVYECQGQVGNQQRRFQLKYEVRSSKWYLYKI